MRRLPSIDISAIPTRELWRTILPASLLNDRTLRRQVADRLASVVTKTGFVVPEVAPEVEVLAKGDTRPLIAVITSMPETPGLWGQARFDERMSLVLWAMLSHENWSGYGQREHPLGRILMAAGLAAWARHLPPPDRKVLESARHRRTREERTSVNDWRRRRREIERMAQDWLRLGVTDEWLLRVDDWTVRHQPRQDAPQEAEAASETVEGPSKVVIQVRVDEAAQTNAERRADAKRWNKLASPLPLIAGPAPDAIRDTLLNEFPWLEGLIDRIHAELSLRQGVGRNRWFHVRPLLLVGAPATGKTRFARRLATVAGVHHRIMNVGGGSDTRELIGTARGWGSAQASGPLRLVEEAGHANPMMILDEIDKGAASDHNGRVADALLTMIERESARSWYDEGIGRSVDLSAITWVCLANSLTSIPAPLRSRLGIIQVPRPAPAHFPVILGHMLADIGQDLGVAADQLPPLHTEAQRYLHRRFAEGASLRQIRSAIEKALAVRTTGIPTH